MTLIARVRSAAAGLRALWRSRADEQALHDELTAFVDAAADDLIAKGVDPETARRHARRTLGNPAVIKEDTRAAGWDHTLEMLWQDARYGARAMRRTPGFTSIIVLTLGLGIGGNAAILGVVDTLYFQALPFPRPDRLLRLQDSAPGPAGDRRLFGMHSQNVAEAAGRSDLFASTVAMFEEDLTITGGADAERVTVISRTAGWHDTLGIEPAAGRDFTTDEERRGRASGVALVSDALWRRRFGGARVGTAVLHLDGRPFVIVGIMPSGFRFPYEADVWIPHVVNPAEHGRDYAVFARMVDGRTLPQVRTAMDLLSARLRAEYADELPGYAIAANMLRKSLVGSEADTSLALIPVVAFLLLLACVNVATLLLARSVARRKESAVRAALGATRLRQVRQSLAEAVLLAGCGGIVGVLLAGWIAPALVTLVPANLVRQLGMRPPGIGWPVIGISAVLSVAAGVACAVLPLVGGRAGSAPSLREGGRGSAMDSPRSRRTLDGLAAAQLVLAILLLSGAAAMVENLLALQRRNLGVAATGLLSLVVTPSIDAYPDGTTRAVLARRIVDRMSDIPGVTAAGITTVNPFGGSSWGASVIREGHDTGSRDAIQVNHRLVTPATFRAMGIPLLQGRDFTWDDAAGGEPVAIVSERMSHQLWPGEDALGRRLRIARPGQPWLTVVGVVGDVADARDRGDPDITWYLPLLQFAGTPAAADLHLMLRAPSGVMADVRGQLAGIDPTLAAYDVSEMDDFYARTLDRNRVGAVTITVIGAFGLLLAALGVYGVMSFGVAERTGEIGVRMALGATRHAIMSFVFARAARLAAAGLVVGSAGALIVRRVVASFLPAVPQSGLGPSVLAAAALVVVIACACYVPARRATRVDPLIALRR
ncbi:MAG TPA: ABC transporter permease [Vicinamibacterales bacterium]|nr:ABC transporter permease [Vicinamibacterales bacterium]